MAKAKVENYNGYPAIMVDGVPYPPMLATIRTNAHDHIVADEEYYKNLGKAGVRIFFVICDTAWLKSDALSQFIEEVETILRAVPDAYIIPRMGLHPPLSWIEENPDELVRYSDGSFVPMTLYTESYVKDLPAMYSLCSQKWREAAGKALSETYDEIEKLPFADRIIGYFLAAGNTSEWYYQNSDGQGEEKERGVCSDISLAFKNHFSKFLKEKYGSDDALQKAWSDPSATLDNPGIASFDSRYYIFDVEQALINPKSTYWGGPIPTPPTNGTNIGSFLDINNHMKTYDYFRAWHIGTADSIIYFANIIKQKSKDKLVGAFAGYYGAIEIAYGGNTGGALKILNSGVVDFLAGPGVYQNRQPGGFTGQREMVDSFRLRNCMYIIEDDARTHVDSKLYSAFHELFTPEEAIEVLKREFGRNVCEDIQSWWFDQPLGGGRYKCPEIIEMISKQQKIAKDAYSKDRTKHNEIAFIYDEESIHLISQRSTFETVQLIRDHELSLIGASVDQYFHDDLANPDMPSYKLYVFLNVYALTNEERDAVHKKLKKDNAVALWLYSPGIVNFDNEKPFDVENISLVTGIKTKMKNDFIIAKFKFNGDSHSATDNIDKGEIFGFNYKMERPICNTAFYNKHSFLYPYFYTDDPDAVVTGYYLQDKVPAFTIKEQDGWTSMYCGTRLLTSDVFREIAKYAGCHIFSEQNDVIYANRNYITIHAAASGEKELKFPFECTPYELYEEKEYGKNVKLIKFSMLKGETKMFELRKN